MTTRRIVTGHAADGRSIVVWDGAVSADEHVAHALRIAADERWPVTRYSITDLRTVTSMTLPNTGPGRAPIWTTYGSWRSREGCPWRRSASCRTPVWG